MCPGFWVHITCGLEMVFFVCGMAHGDFKYNKICNRAKKYI